MQDIEIEIVIDLSNTINKALKALNDDNPEQAETVAMSALDYIGKNKLSSPSGEKLLKEIESIFTLIMAVSNKHKKLGN